MKPNVFQKVTDHAYYRFALLEPYADRMRHGVFPLNVHYDFGSQDEVNSYRAEILQTLMPDKTACIISAKQSHGVNIFVANSPLQIQSKETEIPATDAFLTHTQGIFLMVKTADCQPILMYDPTQNIVAAVHSGWRGTVQNIVGKMVEKMISDFHSRPSDILVTVGPSLGPCCSEFLEREKDFVGLERYFLPHSRVALWAITRDQLLQSGVLLQRIAFSAICTSCHHDAFFSYRADKPDRGRFGSVIGLCYN